MVRAAAIAGVATALACGGKPRPAAPDTAPEGDDLDVADAARAPSVLDHVPADTPYLFVLERPEANPHLESTLAAIQRAVALLRQGPHDEGAEPAPPLRFAEITAAGIDLGSPMVLYGLGLYPALQIGVADAGKLDRALAAAMTALAARRDSIGGKPRWTARLGGGTLVVIAGRDRLAAALLPSALVAALSPVLAGSRRPARSARRLAGQLARRNGLAGRFGFIDVVGAARAVVGVEPFEVAGVEIPAAFDAAGGRGIPRACRRALVDVTREAPRLIYGLRARRPRGERLSLRVELGASIRDRLAGMATPIPALGEALASRAQLAATLGLRHRELLGLLADGLDAIAGLPGCNLDADVGAARRWLRQTAATDLGVAGVAIALTDLGDDPGDLLSRFAGVIAAGIADPDRFDAAAAGWLPGTRRGAAIRVPGPRPAWLRISDRVVAYSAGLDEPDLVDAITGRAPVRGALATLAIRGALAARLQDRDPDPELAAAAPELARQLAELITPVRWRSLAIAVESVADGIEATIDIELEAQKPAGR